MRLWHKDLIPVLPNKQLLGQWRECCAIAKAIHDKGTPNHILVNKVMDYPLDHFYNYSRYVFLEMSHRGYTANYTKFDKWILTMFSEDIRLRDLFPAWHNNRYLLQCFYNLQEKYDCGGISKIDWECIHLFMESRYRPI